MSTKNSRSYDWLPMRLQLTGYDSYWYRQRIDTERNFGGRSSFDMAISNFENAFSRSGSKRYYQGSGEILELLDQAGWPPERPDDFLIWDPAKLSVKTRDLSHFIYGKIGAYLYPRHSADLDLFDLCWKDVITDYVQELNEMPDKLSIPYEFANPENIGLLGACITGDKNEAEEKRTWEYLTSWHHKDHNKIPDRDLERDGASPDLIFLSSQSNHPFLRYEYNRDVERLPDESLGKSYQGIFGTGLPLEIEAKINANLALQLRLKLWWGWPGAPFTCIENMMAGCLEYLVREGYLRHLGGKKYELPSEKAVLFESEPKTLDRLKEALKLLTPGKAAMTVGSTVVKGALSASVPYWINLGRHLLGL